MYVLTLRPVSVSLLVLLCCWCWCVTQEDTTACGTACWTCSNRIRNCWASDGSSLNIVKTRLNEEMQRKTIDYSTDYERLSDLNTARQVAGWL